MASQIHTAFSNRMAQLGYALPASPKIVCCVLTNSAILAGFPVDGVPIVDLTILSQFFENELVELEGRQGGKAFERHTIQFYKDNTEAGHVLERYLLDPPQLGDLKHSVVRREVVFPVESPVFGKFIHETFQVEILTVRSFLGRFAKISTQPHVDVNGKIQQR